MSSQALDGTVASMPLVCETAATTRLAARRSPGVVGQAKHSLYGWAT